MSEVTHGTSSVLRRRILGVPVLYLLGGFVLILAVVAWRTKSGSTATPAEDATGGSPDPNADRNALLTDGDVFPTMPSGSVTGTPAISGPGVNTAITSNDDWLRAAVAFLGDQGITAGTSQLALQTYLNGDMLTFDQGAMRDRVVKQFGLPPTVNSVGITSPKPTPPLPVIIRPPTPVKPPVNTPKPAPAIHAVPKTAAKVVKAPAHPYPGGLIRQGSKGANVKLIQQKVGTKADGAFGPNTAAAVRQYQASHGLSVDGIVGPKTWAKMFG